MTVTAAVGGSTSRRGLLPLASPLPHTPWHLAGVWDPGSLSACSSHSGMATGGSQARHATIDAAGAGDWAPHPNGAAPSTLQPRSSKGPARHSPSLIRRISAAAALQGDGASEAASPAFALSGPSGWTDDEEEEEGEEESSAVTSRPHR